MKIIIVIISVLFISVIIFLAINARRGLKIASYLNKFMNTFQFLIEQGETKEEALHISLQELRKAPRFDIIEDKDIEMIVQTLSPLKEPQKAIEKLVLKADSKKAPLMLKDHVTMTKLAEIANKYE